MTQRVRTRQFQVSPHIIMSLIKAQAGTLGKGLLECIMNSIDAGATEVDITLEPTRLLVVDDGKGFTSSAEIEACFEVFGFEHQEGDRKFGAFGLGRAQLWNFVSTVWRTNEFTMDVDIRTRGLDYDLADGASPPVKGLRIEGKFYETQKTADILATTRELTDLAAFVEIPVYLNGECINTDVKNVRWTHETDEAWVLLNGNMRSLVVYNLGAKIREYPSYQFGTGGIVVTKPGVRMKLNMARNDILLSECSVWKRIKPFLQAKADESVRKSTRLSDDQLSNLATRFFDGELPAHEIVEYKLVTDVLGNKHTLREFIHKASGTSDKCVTAVPKSQAGPIAEASHKSKFCFVLDTRTLTRFGVHSVGQFLERLADAAKEAPTVLNARSAASLNSVEDWREACKKLSKGHTEVPHKDWTKREQAAIATLKHANNQLVYMMQRCGVIENTTHARELRLGLSESAHAWTDGKGFIWFNRELLALFDQGLGGALRVLTTAVHEYLHEDPSDGSHVHGEEFYERFHKVMQYIPSESWQRSLGDIVTTALSRYMQECAKRDLRIFGRVATQASAAESYLMVAPDNGATGQDTTQG